MYARIDAGFYKESMPEDDKKTSNKMSEVDVMSELHKVMSNGPCADEKYAMYEKLRIAQKQYE